MEIYDAIHASALEEINSQPSNKQKHEKQPTPITSTFTQNDREQKKIAREFPQTLS